MISYSKRSINRGRVLFVGQSYYHPWYLSRELRKLGWKVDLLNIDGAESNQVYYHGEDFRFTYQGIQDVFYQLLFYFKSLFTYEIFHFSNAHGLMFGNYVHGIFKIFFGEYSEIWLLKKIGKKIVYSNNGCIDGVSQTSFSHWGPDCVCDLCIWKDHPEVCSDSRNLAWGKIRNELADYQIASGGNRLDYNDDPHVHEVPEFYCLDQIFWSPELLVPANYLLPFSKDTIKIFHSVGNFDTRTGSSNVNIKCTHIYLPLIERLKNEGYPVELIFFKDVPNKTLRYYQAQADIIVDMLTFGWFGANIREAMMLGKPCICFLRPEWLGSIKKELPEFVEELPVINATPATIYSVLKDLIEHPKKREEIGKRSREFAVKWYSAEAGAKRLDLIYSDLLHKN